MEDKNAADKNRGWLYIASSGTKSDWQMGLDSGQTTLYEGLVKFKQPNLKMYH